MDVDVEHLADRPDHAHEGAEGDAGDDGSAGAGEIDREALPQGRAEPAVDDEAPSGFGDGERRGEEARRGGAGGGPPEDEDEAEEGEPQGRDRIGARPAAGGGGGLRRLTRSQGSSLIGHARFSAIASPGASRARPLGPPTFV